MPKQVDKLRKIKYKQSRLKGNSIAQSLRDSGYSEGRARQSSHNAVVKQSESEIMEQVKASEITVEWVINRLTNELKSTDCKASDRIRIAELLGKYLNMFKDNNIQQVALFIDKDIEHDAKRVIDDVSSSNSNS